MADQGLSFGPVPAWVFERDVPKPTETDAAVRHILSDVQIDISGEHAWSHRTISQALSSEGVNSIASFSVAYLPSFQRVIIHRVRLIRGDNTMDLADPEGFQLLRREPNLERRIYDGALTADLQLSDVRPGDALETWFTIVGSNPALKGIFDASLALAFAVPVEETCLRLRAPVARKLVIATLPEGSTCEYEEVEAAPGIVDRQWRVRQEEPFVYEDSPPPWWAGHKRVNIDDALTWSQIADLFRPAYAEAETLSSDLEVEVQRIETASSDPAVRAIAALRFVQSSIRYLAISIGTGGFEPREVDQIWTTRFGDCKDMSRLLSSILTRLGVKACPALVSTLGKDPTRKPHPHVYAFNHCIVRVEIDGVVRWLDATNAGQGGDFARMVQPSFEWALPLFEGADIERIAPAEQAGPLVESNETISFGRRPTDPVGLTIETTHRGWRADQIRGAVRREGLAAVAEHWRKYHSNLYGGTHAVKPVELVDDIDANELRTVETYTLNEAWRIEGATAHFSYIDTMIAPDLPVIPRAGRTQPLGIGLARRLRRATRFTSAVRSSLSSWDVPAEAPGIKGRAKLTPSLFDATEFSLEVDYAITQEYLDQKDFDSFMRALSVLRRGSGIGLAITLNNGEFVDYAMPKPDKTGGRAFFWGVRIVIVLWIMFYVAAFLYNAMNW